MIVATYLSCILASLSVRWVLVVRFISGFVQRREHDASRLCTDSCRPCRGLERVSFCDSQPKADSIPYQWMLTGQLRVSVDIQFVGVVV